MPRSPEDRVDSLPVAGRVLGIDVGYSRSRATTGICRLEWDASRVDWRCVTAETNEASRLAQLAALGLTRETPVEVVAIDGPLRPRARLRDHLSRAGGRAQPRPLPAPRQARRDERRRWPRPASRRHRPRGAGASRASHSRRRRPGLRRAGRDRRVLPEPVPRRALCGGALPDSGGGAPALDRQALPAGPAGASSRCSRRCSRSAPTRTTGRSTGTRTWRRSAARSRPCASRPAASRRWDRRATAISCCLPSNSGRPRKPRAGAWAAAELARTLPTARERFPELHRLHA